MGKARELYEKAPSMFSFGASFVKDTQCLSVGASFVKDTQCWMFVKEFAQRLAQLRAAGKILQ